VKYLSALSIDTVIGVGAGLAFFQVVFSFTLPWYLWVGLMGGTWLLYTLDRLLDGQRYDVSDVSLLPFRHQFHRQHSTVMWVFWVIFSVFLGGVFVIYVPKLYYLLVMMLVFIFIFHQLFLPTFWYGWIKEWVVMVVYIGALVGPFLLVGDGAMPTLSQGSIVLFYGVLVYFNLQLSCLIEFEFRVQSDRMGFSQLFNPDQLARLLWGLLFVLVILWVSLYMMEVPLLVLGVLGLMMMVSRRLMTLDWSGRDFHLYGEMVFWTPALVLLPLL